MTLSGRRASRRRRPLVAGAVAVGAIVTFAIGVALGQALEENEPPGGTQTSIRTLAPETLPAESVTVTVPAP